MELKTLDLINWRNFSKQQFLFSQNNLIIGNNGKGKTNILEAISLLTISRSFRTPSLFEAIKYNEDYFRVTAEYITDENQRSIDYFYQTKPELKRQITLNQKVIQPKEIWGNFLSVTILPTDLEIVFGSPQVRRQFLNTILWLTSAEFRFQYQRFTGVLKERAQLLINIKRQISDLVELQPWNLMIAELTEFIRLKRQQLLNLLVDQINQNQTKLTKLPPISIDYKANDFSLDLVNEEIRCGQNLYGAHRDEILIKCGNHWARRYASRGQARMITTLLRAAQINYLSSTAKSAPVLLIDDYSAELDRDNIDNLFKLLPREHQVIMTTSKDSDLNSSWQIIDLNTLADV